MTVYLLINTYYVHLITPGTATTITIQTYQLAHTPEVAGQARQRSLQSTAMEQPWCRPGLCGAIKILISMITKNGLVFEYFCYFVFT